MEKKKKCDGKVVFLTCRVVQRNPQNISCIHAKASENMGQSKRGTQTLNVKNNNKTGNFVTLCV